MAYSTGFRSTATADAIYGADYSTAQYGNAIDGINADVYVPIIFSKKMLKDFYAMTVFSEISNTDYEGEIKSGGDKVYIRRVPTLSIDDYSLGGGAGINYEVPHEDAEVLNIDQAKYWAFQMDYIDEAQTDLQLVSEFSANAAEQLKIHVDTDVLDYFCDPTLAHADNVNSAAFVSGTTGAGALSHAYDMGYQSAGGERQVNATADDADNILNVIVEMNAVLDENNIPEGNRWVVLPPVICQLLKKGDLKRADVTGDGTGVIRTGLIGQVDGMKIYKSVNLPNGTGTTLTSYLCPFGNNMALTFAGQITKSETGTLERTFGKYWRGLFVYGRTVVQPKAFGVAVLSV